MEYLVYDMDEMIDKISICYPDEITYETDLKRTYNNQSLINFILNDIQLNDLRYNQKERRIKLYTTPHNESIYIQYPGKYSMNRNGTSYPFDFRPIAIVNGERTIDVAFKDLWEVIDNYISAHQDFVPVLNNLLFRLGRMYDYSLVQAEYESCFIINSTDIVPADSVSLSMYQLHIEDSKLLNSLNLHARKIKFNTVDMTMEAFLYYVDSLIQIEDCKFKESAVNSTKGRINTSDSLMVIYAYRMGVISLAELLQRFVQSRGIAHCDTNEYSPVSKNTIQISHINQRIEELCTNHNITYTLSKKINAPTEEITVTSARLQLPQKHILILNEPLSNPSEIEFLRKYNWDCYVIFDYIGEKTCELDNIIKEKIFFDNLYELYRQLEDTSITYSHRQIRGGGIQLKPLANIEEKKIAIFASELSEEEKTLLRTKSYTYYTLNDISTPAELSTLINSINSVSTSL